MKKTYRHIWKWMITTLIRASILYFNPLFFIVVEYFPDNTAVERKNKDSWWLYSCPPVRKTFSSMTALNDNNWQIGLQSTRLGLERRNPLISLCRDFLLLSPTSDPQRTNVGRLLNTKKLQDLGFFCFCKLYKRVQWSGKTGGASGNIN